MYCHYYVAGLIEGSFIDKLGSFEISLIDIIVILNVILIDEFCVRVYENKPR